MTRAPRTLSPRDPVAFAINWMAIEGFRNVPASSALRREDVAHHAVLADHESHPSRQ
jgi:hypothetical protein